MNLPLPYHLTTSKYFQNQPAVWEFFTTKKSGPDSILQFKSDLLKNSYKFDASTETSLYNKVEVAKTALGLTLPVTLYQAQHSDEMNATIAYVGGEAHIVFSGKLIQTFTDEELQAIVAHELSHIHLYTHDSGSIETADRIITAISNQQGSSPAHYETARIFKLYTEIFCDRGAYLVTQNYAPIISSLVKLSTGLNTVNVESYIKQAEEIFALESTTKSTGITHPENFIRARAIALWHSKRSTSEAEIKNMIEGQMSIDELDIFQQEKISDITKKLLEVITTPKWIQTATIIALAKQYFGSLEIKDREQIVNVAINLEHSHSSLQNYFSYVLYDFATADKTLENLPLGHSFFIADEIKISDAFAQTVKKEQKLTDKKTQALKKQMLEEYHKVANPITA